jgi:hypothetical protein
MDRFYSRITEDDFHLDVKRSRLDDAETTTGPPFGEPVAFRS